MKALFAEYLVWDTPFRVGSHHYAAHFSDRGWEIGWLGGEFHLLNLFNNRSELARKLPIWQHGGQRHPEGPWEYTPLKLFPYRRLGPLGHQGFAWGGSRWTLPPVRRVLGRAGFGRADLLWLTNVQAYPWLVRRPGYRAIVYRVADDHTAFAGSPRSLRAVEETVVRRADAVFAVSRTVYERLHRVRSEGVYYLPNGVNLSRFDASKPLPPEYADLHCPIAIYVGAINYWFDLDLLTKVARRRDDIAFVLIGQAHVSLGPLAGLRNVHFLGTRPPDQVPAYLQHANVGLIPFVHSSLTDSINPLKMYEYFACGLPTICTPMREVLAMCAPVLVADDVQSFLSGLDQALAADEGTRRSHRAFAAQHTWDKRYAQVDAVVDELLT